MSKTFETFPIVRPFELKKHSEDDLCLLLRQGDRSLYELAQECAKQSLATSAIQQSKRNFERNRLDIMQDRLNLALLDVYGLPPTASDLAILDRLLVTNSRS